MIRHQYGNERMPEYAEWMPEAYEEWEHLEQVSGETLLKLVFLYIDLECISEHYLVYFYLGSPHH